MPCFNYTLLASNGAGHHLVERLQLAGNGSYIRACAPSRLRE